MHIASHAQRLAWDRGLIAYHWIFASPPWFDAIQSWFDGFLPYHGIFASPPWLDGRPFIHKQVCAQHAHVHVHAPSLQAAEILFRVLGTYKQLVLEDPRHSLNCASTLVLIAELTRDKERALTQLGSALRTYKSVVGDKQPVSAGQPIPL